jgi:hypothetical protein
MRGTGEMMSKEIVENLEKLLQEALCETLKKHPEIPMQYQSKLGFMLKNLPPSADIVEPAEKHPVNEKLVK